MLKKDVEGLSQLNMDLLNEENEELIKEITALKEQIATMQITEEEAIDLFFKFTKNDVVFSFMMNKEEIINLLKSKNLITNNTSTPSCHNQGGKTASSFKKED
jgi:hypothetical protein